MVLPPEIGDQETIVRAIKSPHHLNKSRTRLTRSAFTPPAGSDEISVMRLGMGAEQCLEHAERIANAPGSSFSGVCCSEAAVVRQQGVAVVDQPKEFLGHAGIVYVSISEGLRTRAKGEALDPEVRLKLQAIVDGLMAVFQYLPDPVVRDGALVMADSSQ